MEELEKELLTQEEADKKFAAWLEEKDAKIQAKKEGLTKVKRMLRAKRLADEKAVSDKRISQTLLLQKQKLLLRDAALKKQAPEANKGSV